MVCFQVISYRSCDNTRENCFFQIWSYSRAYVRIISENTKKSTTCNNSLKAESKTTKQKLIGLLPLRRGDPFNYNYFWIPKYAERYVSIVAGKYHDVIAGKRHFFNLTSPRPRKNHSGRDKWRDAKFSSTVKRMLVPDWAQKNVMYRAPSANSIFWVLFMCSYMMATVSPYLSKKTDKRAQPDRLYIHTYNFHWTLVMYKVTNKLFR